MKRHSPAFMRDVRFFLRNRHRFTFTGSADVVYTYDRNGIDGIAAYKALDSQGRMRATRHPTLAQTLTRTKASVNFHVKMWKDGAKDMGFTPDELNSYLSEINAPTWVRDAIGKAYGRGTHTPQEEQR